MSAASALGRASLLALGVAACAGDAPPDPGASQDEAYAIAASLVQEVGPRLGGTDGDRRAVDWAVRMLREQGFQNVRTEPATVPRWQRGPFSLELRVPEIRALDAVALGGSAPTPAGGIEAPVVMVRSFTELEALPDNALRGRIVFINGRMPRSWDGSGYRLAVPQRSKGPVVAAAKGARATLIRSVGTGPHPHTGATRYDGGTQIPAAALASADADLLERLLAGGAAVSVRLVIGSAHLGEAVSANVIGEIPGASDEIVLLGAHLDSWDITPGANDDAAGVGIVVAAARRVASQGLPRRTLRVVLFAGEEHGLGGGKAYAAAHAADAARHVVALEADAGSGPPLRLHAAVGAPDWPRVMDLANRLGLEAGENGVGGGADLGPLRKLGVPELIVAQDMTRYFDVHHTRADVVETLDRDGLAQMTAVVAALAQAACDQPRFERLPPAP